MQILLIGNGPYRNRGCEAIVRGTVEILKGAFGGALSVVNANYDFDAVPTLPSDGIEGLSHRPISRTPGGTIRRRVDHVLDRVGRAVVPNKLYRRLSNRPIRELVRESAAVLAVGGDNFTLDYGAFSHAHLEQNRFVIDQGKPLVILGASIGPFEPDPRIARLMHHHLRDEVTAIVARERETISYLERHGISKNVFFAFDPAFAMRAEPVRDEQLGFAMPQGAIGLNLSKFVAEKAGIGRSEIGQWMANMLRELRNTTGRPVMLIPHVTTRFGDDHVLMQAGLAACNPMDDIYSVPPTLNAAQYKDVISKVDVMIAARTHATIAAFSSGVPTISLAYSSKAWGLNRLIFGHDEYVISPDNLNARTLCDKARRVLDEGAAIRSDLARKAPEFRASAMSAGVHLKRLLSL